MRFEFETAFFGIDTDIKRNHSNLKRFRNLSTLLWLFPIVIWSSCQTSVKPSEQRSKIERHFFDEYKDTLVKVTALNSALNTNFKQLELGKPIGVSGTPHWLVTVGGWYINDKNIVLQGSAFKPESAYPIRNTEVEFRGSFTGIALFNEETNEYSWLIEPENHTTGLKYQRTKNYHLLVLNEDNEALEFREITTAKSIKITPEFPIIEWSVNSSDDEIIALLQQGSQTTVKSYAIASLLSEQPE